MLEQYVCLCVCVYTRVCACAGWIYEENHCSCCPLLTPDITHNLTCWTRWCVYLDKEHLLTSWPCQWREPPTISLQADVDSLSTPLKEVFFSLFCFFSFFLFFKQTAARSSSRCKLSERSLHRLRLWQCSESILDLQAVLGLLAQPLEQIRLTLNLCKEC